MAAARLLLVLPAAALLAGCLPSTHAISSPVCDDGGAVWVTEQPHTEATTPGSDLLFFCESGLNLLGDPISACIEKGKVCTPPVADAVCQLLGFDKVWNGDFTVAPAPGSQAAKALSGEWCVRVGQYSDTRPQNATQLPGDTCPAIKRITCLKSREHLVRDLQTSLLIPAPEAAQLLVSLNTPPASELVVNIAPLPEGRA